MARLVVDGETVDSELERLTTALVGELMRAGVGPGEGAELGRVDPVLHVAAVEATERLDAPLVLRRKGPWPSRPGLYDIRAVVSGTARHPGVRPVVPAEGRPPFPVHARVVLWTSGSSGDPKAVLLSREAVEHQALATCARMEYEPADRLALPLPLHHSYGFGVVQSWRHSGATLLLHTSFELAHVVTDLVSQRTTSVDAVPSLYSALAALARRDERLRAALVRLRLRGCGGDLLGEDLARHYADEIGAPLHDGYGLTEAGPNVALSAPLVLRIGSVGTPIDGVEVRTNPGDGEIQVRGPSLMSEYCGDPEATAEAFTIDGWLRTGDIGAVDADSYVTIRRRMKDCLVVHGETFPPTVIEQVLLGSTLLDGAVVVGVPSGTARGDVVVAFVRSDLDRTTDRLESVLRMRCRAALPAHLRPRVFERVAEWPYLPSGKVDRRALRERASTVSMPAGADHSDSRPTTENLP